MSPCNKTEGYVLNKKQQKTINECKTNSNQYQMVTIKDVREVQGGRHTWKGSLPAMSHT